MTIHVSPLSCVEQMVAAHGPSHVVSILDPEFAFPDLGAEYRDRQLRLRFHDAHREEDGQTPPAADDVERLLQFLGGWDRESPILVHCRAGIGRSTAAAFVIACYAHPTIAERHIAEVLRRNGPLSRPNETLVRLGDVALRRNGRMSSAIAETGRGLPWIEIHEGIPFALPSRFEEYARAVPQRRGSAVK